MATERVETFYQIVHTYFENFFEKLNISSRDVIVYVSCFGGGFLVGVLFKRYGKWIVSISAAVILALALLQYFDFITIHQNNIRAVIGLEDAQGFDFLVEQSKNYLVELGVIIVGLLVGFKLG
jgi:hypothetical protein